MKILITGIVVLAIWSFFSMWLYVDFLKPAARKPAEVQVVDNSQTREADSLARLYASMPKVLLIHFDFDGKKFTPTAETDSRIAEFKSWIEKYPASVVQVTGHTDFIGTPEYNTDLALERALAVKQYLSGKGIPADRIETLSKGEEQPVADLFTTEGRRLNRRTEISIKK